MQEFDFEIYALDRETFLENKTIKAKDFKAAIKQLNEFCNKNKLTWDTAPRKSNIGTQRSPFGIGS